MRLSSFFLRAEFTRPIFVAAKENGFAGSSRSGRALSVAAFLAGVAHPRRQKHREMPPPGASAPAFAATVEPTFTQIISNLPPAYLQSDSSNERVLGMTCAVFPVYTLMRASILDFRARLANRCKLFPVYALFRASILDFRPRLANRCKGRMVPPAAAVATTIFRVRFYSS